MSIWIVTTGNSDVRLKHERNWCSLYAEVRDNLECDRFASPNPIDPNDKKAGYTVPARVLGLVYENQSDFYESDLKFPIFDTYCQYFAVNKIKPETIVILLTDQSHIFPEEQRIYEKCPYWQDTCTLKPLLSWYFKEHFDCKIEFEYLTPESGEGVDHWNETLVLVEKTLQKLDCNPLKTVYVSHQAGTPAISSSVQFVSLGRFKKVNFLVSNQYYDDDYNQQSAPQAIESSNYWRGMQIQKAKQLIIDGLPGAAFKVLEGIERIDEKAISELKQLVDFFNLHSRSTDSSHDFEIPQATQRIVDTLDLIGFCFNQKNYLQGIALLAAAQETFLKAAVCHEIDKINAKYRQVKVSALVKWSNAGLYLISNEDLGKTLNLSQNDDLNIIKIEISKVLKFTGDINFETNTNNGLLQWLRQLRTDFQPWWQLRWSCKYDRKREFDLRNQLMHNLRGMEDSEVIQYLLGYEKNNISNVMEAYNNHVKQPFFNAINLFNLPCKREKLHKKLQEIADSLI